MDPPFGLGPWTTSMVQRSGPWTWSKKGRSIDQGSIFSLSFPEETPPKTLSLAGQSFFGIYLNFKTIISTSLTLFEHYAYSF